MDPQLVALIDDAARMSATDLRRIDILRTRQWHDLCRVFDRFDALLCATMSLPAPPVEATDADFDHRDAEGYRGIDLTGQFNFVAQCPALSVPCGWSSDGMPLGLQVVGHRFADDTVMRIGAAMEAAQPWAARRPPE
jgi:Asp-tRNA(Asn)/Glu-tRNA(Gln) amidotransferase A subunit family amidase